MGEMGARVRRLQSRVQVRSGSSSNVQAALAGRASVRRNWLDSLDPRTGQAGLDWSNDAVREQMLEGELEA